MSSIWRTNLDAAKIEAAQSGKLVLLHFYTTTCGPCKMLDENVFSQGQIGDSIEQSYVPVKIDAGISSAIANVYQIDRVPQEVVLDTQGNVVAKLSCPPNAPEYIAQLNNLNEHWRQYQSRQGTTSQAPVQSAYAGLQVGRYQQQNGMPQSSGLASTANPHTAAPATGNTAASTPIQAAPPAMTNNPYAVQQTNPVAATAPAMTNNRYAASAEQNSQPANQQHAELPANAMPNSFHTQTMAAAPTTQNTQPHAASAEVPPSTVATAPTQVLNPETAQITKTSHVAMTPQIPAGSPPLAFDGYCPVSLRTAHKWVAGNPKYGAIHRGRTFLFATEEQRQQFFSNPDAYCPVFSGMDPVLLLEKNEIVEGSRKFGFEYRGAFYLFASKESMDLFKSQPDHFAGGVRQAMNRMTASADNTVLR